MEKDGTDGDEKRKMAEGRSCSSALTPLRNGQELEKEGLDMTFYAKPVRSTGRNRFYHTFSVPSFACSVGC